MVLMQVTEGTRHRDLTSDPILNVTVTIACHCKLFRVEGDFPYQFRKSGKKT